MTTIPFVPSSAIGTVPFQTTITLDGAQYFLSTYWNLAGQRWYISITDQSGNLIKSMPLVGSPLDSDINLVFNVFTTSTLVYRADTGEFEVDP